MNRRTVVGSIGLVALLLGLVVASFAEVEAQNPQKRGGGQGREFPLPKSGWPVANVILGAPTDRSVTFAIHPRTTADFRIEYGQSEPLKSIKSCGKIAGGGVAQIELTGLQPNRRYVYRIVARGSDSAAPERGPLRSFWTQRKPDSPFVFMVQGDSHPERNPKMNVPELYERTLSDAKKSHPDFFVCLGDDFSVDTLRERTPETIEAVYRKQVPYLALVGDESPVFLVNGNHEQAALANYDGSETCLATLAQNARNRNFAQPAPNGFYSGNDEKLGPIGFLRNYYAWTWGDALFVVIDPYWHSKSAVDNPAGGRDKRSRDLWNVTLGDRQYQWLKKTLTASPAKFKFVFAHHVHGTGRGGVEQAPYYEWGGQDRNGSNAFQSKRPGWDIPIHQLFVRNGVTIFFQGHDHIFARQTLDGVTYQTCPVPADASNQLINGDAYTVGDKVVGAGLLRVSVGSSESKVEFLRSFLPSDEKDGHHHGEVAFSYVVTPRKPVVSK